VGMFTTDPNAAFLTDDGTRHPLRSLWHQPAGAFPFAALLTSLDVRPPVRSCTLTPHVVDV
jgi:hypothetical protein